MFNIYSNKFIKKGIIKNNIRSYNWHELYLDQNGSGGDFEFKIKGDYYKDIIVKGDFIENTNSRKFGVVEEIKKETAADGSVLTTIISGRMGEKLLLNRIIYPQLNVKGTPKTLITDIMNRNVINPSVLSRKMPFALNFMDEDGTELTESFCGETVAKALYSILYAVDMGYYCSLDIENKKVVLNVFKGNDKSKQITYSIHQKNIYDYSELSSNKNAFNHVIVKGAAHSNQIPYVTSFQKGLEGFDRVEQFMTEEAIDNKQLALSDYEVVLKNQGREKLKEGIIEEAYDFAVSENHYVYNEEIWLGDIVSIYSLDLSKKSSQKVIGYLYTKSENGKEEEGFTFSKIATLTDDVDVFVELGDKEDEDIDSDITEDQGGGGGDGGNKYPIHIGHIMCTDNKRIRGSIIEVSKDNYRMNIYTWNDNKDVEVTVTDETTGETTTEIMTKTFPYKGKIYIGCDFDILSHIGVPSDTVDIDNFDNSKTRITVSSARKGVLFRDEFDRDHGLLFENPTLENANDKTYYEYTIESENLNFNFTIDISTIPVEENVPLKKYSNSLRVYLNYAHGNGYKANDYNYYDYFLPETFWADEGDYIKLVCNYCELTHTNDPDNPYVPGEWQEREFIWYFQEGELVKDKVIRLPEGGYDFNNGSTWGWSSSFKKLKYLKKVRASSNNRAGYYGNLVFGCKNSATAKPINSDINECFLVKQNPAFDTLEGLDAIRWIWCSNKTVNKIKVPKYESPYYGNYQLSLVTSTGGDNLSVLENICDPVVWSKILAENPDMFIEE